MKLNVKKGDSVMVIAGKDKGKAGKVLGVDTDSGRIYVEGVNIIKKHVKPKTAQQKGGILKQEGTLDSSNVMHICPACNEVVRIGHKEITEGGKLKKIRVCKKCGASMDEKKPSAKKTAKKVAKKAGKKKDDVKATDKAEIKANSPAPEEALDIVSAEEAKEALEASESEAETEE